MDGCEPLGRRFVEPRFVFRAALDQSRKFAPVPEVLDQRKPETCVKVINFRRPERKIAQVMRNQSERFDTRCGQTGHRIPAHPRPRRRVRIRRTGVALDPRRIHQQRRGTILAKQTDIPPRRRILSQ